ncbi:ABC transporter substrate-binding protein [soil metagenome]
MNRASSRVLNRRLVTGGGLALAASFAGFKAAGTLAQSATPEASPMAGRLLVHLRGETLVPANPTKVIAIGDEFLLADLLDFGIRPIASSASYGDHFIGLTTEETAGIESFTFWDADIEELLMLGPDLFVVPDYVFAAVDGLYEILSQVAPTVSIAEDPEWENEYRFAASIFGKEELADELIANMNGAIESAATELNLAGQSVSVATVYPGDPSVTLWLLPAIAHTDVLTRLGLTLTPNAADYSVDHIGRAFLSVEQVNVIGGETLIMLQSTDQPDETTVFETVTSDPLWQTIPALQNDRVFISERIGFPGEVRGRIKLIEEYRAIFA